MLRQIPATSIGTSIVRKKTIKVFLPLKKRGGAGITPSETEQAEEFNGQLMDVCLTKMIIVRSHSSEGRPLSWMTLSFQKRM